MKGATILVTGGGGFLGGAIVRQLLERGAQVRSLSRQAYPELEKAGVQQFHGSLTDLAAVEAAVKGCDIVFHVAAKAGIWGDYDSYYQTNVVGTENIITACRKHAVRRLVYTSSPSVVFNGTDMEGVDESVPYPDHFEAPYPKTKAIAEQKIVAANDATLATVSLRPHLIWGPGDNHLVPRILAKGRAGQIRRVGNRENKVDSIYIDNAADAHLLAAEKLQPGSVVAGKVYFISQDEPVSVWALINRILACGGVPPVTKSVPSGLAYFAGTVCEFVHRTFGIEREPRMTRFVARELSTAHWFNITAAKRDLGYRPKVSIDEGLKRLAATLKTP
ncbi:MAG TPA: NAD-dependent epimerase/dehydratase family protein [Roseimicrobium sp.]|nr:NAD-dependent epimerase/dehydratase family protein [Roseimicrobium sp.]